MQVTTNCTNPEKHSVYIIFEDKYDCTVIGVASSFDKAECLAEEYNEKHKKICRGDDLIEREDLWIEELPLDELAEEPW